MKKMFYRFFSVALVLVLTLSLSTTAFAQSSISEEAVCLHISTSTGVVNVKIPQRYVNALSQDELTEIISGEKVKNGDTINIERVVTPKNPFCVASPTVIIPPMVLYRYTTTKTKTGTEHVQKDVFITSAARGETKTLEQEFSASLKTSITGDFYVDLGLDATISITIKKGETRVGPPEDSIYNSREYRVKFFAQDYKWTQYRYLIATGKLISTASGTASVPTKYAEYSIDSKQ